MKSTITTTEKSHQLISVIIPSLNGNYAKLLFLTGNEYKALQETSTLNIGKIGKNEAVYALYAESNIYHDVLPEGGCLTRKQFDELLKENYNSKYQKGRGDKPLKDAL